MTANTKQHDAAVARLLAAAKKVTLREASDAFLASLSTRKLDWRRALGAFVIARHMPAHTYVKQAHYESNDTCGVCSFEAFDGEEFLQSPGVLADHIEKLGGDRPKPTEEDIAAFNGILVAVAEQGRLAIDGRVRRAELMKALSPVFKGSKYERMELLDDLGFCSVLSTKEAPGFLRQFIKHDDRPDGSGNNEFAYPFALWKASDGIDRDALSEVFPQKGIDPDGAKTTSAKKGAAPFDEKKALAELMKLSEIARPKKDKIAKVLFAPGGIWIVRLTDDRFALFNKVGRRWQWMPGARDDVLASVPEAMFEQAVAALGTTSSAKAKPKMDSASKKKTKKKKKATTKNR